MFDIIIQCSNKFVKSLPRVTLWQGLDDLYAAASNMFSIKIPYPVVGSLTRTWVTAPTSFPSCIIGEPDTLMSSKGQRNFAFFCGFYAHFRVKGRFSLTANAVLKLT